MEGERGPEREPLFLSKIAETRETYEYYERNNDDREVDDLAPHTKQLWRNV